jgi:long-chain acyl-CoA synthetase
MDWWGPIIYEYYGYSEGSGFARIAPQEWLTHKGSVGRPVLGTVRILDEHGKELPTGEPGVIWIEGGMDFAYHNDQAKTASVHDAQGRTSVGDMGYLDAEGYLYLTDRVSHMIISGGVNIYPQEVENLLVMHPELADAAVIGVPDAEYGERVLAVVVPARDVQADAALAARLIEHCRNHIAHYKCPKAVEFVDSLPRLPTGKLLKRHLRERFTFLKISV